MRDFELNEEDLDFLMGGVHDPKISKEKLEQLYKLKEEAIKLQQSLETNELTEEELNNVKAGIRR